MTNYFITGGAGFIGSRLSERLLKDGHRVTVYALKPKRKELLTECMKHTNFTFVEGDALDAAKLEKAMKKHDFVFHLAANPDVKRGVTDPKIEFNGIAITFNVLEAMRKNNVTSIAFASSAMAYGNPTKFPTPENYGPMLPVSLYGASKLSGEALISAYCGTFGFTAWIFRYANIIGAKATHGIILDLLRKLEENPTHLEILGDGKQKRAYLHLSDCIEGMLTAIKQTKQRGVELFNLAGIEPISVRQVAELILHAKNMDTSKIRYTGSPQGWKGDVSNVNLDTTKLQDKGWKPKMNSKEAVRMTIGELLEEKN